MTSKPIIKYHIPIDHKHSRCKNVICNHCFCDICDCHYSECYQWHEHCKIDESQESLFAKEKAKVLYLRNKALSMGIINILSTKKLYFQLINADVNKKDNIKEELTCKLIEKTPEYDEEEETCVTDEEEIECEISPIINEFQKIMIQNIRKSISPIPAREFKISRISAFSKPKPLKIKKPFPKKIIGVKRDRV